MAERLKDSCGEYVPRTIARQIKAVWPASFFYLPHTTFVAEFGLKHYEASMNALHVLTKRFTSEFAIRPFLNRYENESLHTLAIWVLDDDARVRRLVSEGTRPRLPWAARLQTTTAHRSQVLHLLEQLRDDPDEVVRRSVANHLNDVGRDNPKLLIGIARNWMKHAPDSRESLIRHALRTLVKQGNVDALKLLGVSHSARLTVENAKVSPKRVKLGATTTISFDVRNAGAKLERALVDLRVHYAKANGKASCKVFKLKSAELGAGDAMELCKTLKLQDLTTRTHYPGVHRVEALVNGRTLPIGEFRVLSATPAPVGFAATMNTSARRRK